MLRSLVLCISALVLATPSHAQLLASSALLLAAGSGNADDHIYFASGSLHSPSAGKNCGLWVDTRTPDAKGGPGTVRQFFWANAQTGHYEVAAKAEVPAFPLRKKNSKIWCQGAAKHLAAEWRKRKAAHMSACQVFALSFAGIGGAGSSASAPSASAPSSGA